ncbi:MAG: DUF2344 domain-containing protein [Synergistaceae bacterium]|nr:DUF2344 domain-containing protein [Synergistaceae bacterium]
MRVRFIYSKRNGACFVPHIALAQMFSRSASRAGLKLTMTQGFSPRAKISFAPELPAGVVALNEPVDMFFEFDKNAPKNLIDLMNDSLPEGFNISRVIFPPDDSPSLGKVCKAAEYLIRVTPLSNLSVSARHLPLVRGDFESMARIAAPEAGEGNRFSGGGVISQNVVDDWTKIIIKDPAQNPIGGLVKFMISENIISGWQDINIVRTSIGIYDEIKGCVSI